MTILFRRDLLQLAAIIFPGIALRLSGADGPETRSTKTFVGDIFPTQPPELVREMVLVAHFDLQRVKELVEARPSLAKAAWDWGFGDWETALGAASHMGNRPIAEYLISRGAQPSLFSAAMLGQLEVVKAFVTAQPGAQRIRGPHTIPLLAHAKAGGDAARTVFEYLESLGDAGSDPVVPLTDGDVQRITGTYFFGVGANQQIEVTFDRNQLTWTRQGNTGRPLIHVSERTFYPTGAPAVRIRFAEENGGSTMSIYDPDLVLTARKKQQSK